MRLSSREAKQVLNISDCQLMHKRTSGNIKYLKQGNSFFYEVKEPSLLLKLPICHKIVNWYKGKHPSDLDNTPTNEQSIHSIVMMAEKILIPLEKKFGEISITYGFTSSALTRYIQKSSREGTYPLIDQHSSSELNIYNKLICQREGLACDFVIAGYETKVGEIVRYIVNNLDFDKIYYYGNNKPLHVSIGPDPERHLQIMNISDKGRRIPGKKAYQKCAIKLAAEL